MSTAMRVVTGRAMRNHRKLKRQVRGIWTQASASAMARGTAKARTLGRRYISRETGLKQKVLKSRIGRSKVKRRPGFTRARLWLRGGLVPPEAWSEPRQTKKGVRAGRVAYDGAFLARAGRGRSAGKVTVFRRDGRARGPISRQGIDLSEHEGAFLRIAGKAFGPVYRRRLEHELDRRMRRKGLK